jgi:hypothetical protein
MEHTFYAHYIIFMSYEFRDYNAEVTRQDYFTVPSFVN